MVAVIVAQRMSTVDILSSMASTKQATPKYVLVDWDADHSWSGVSTSRLKTRDGKNVTQKWPDGEYAGVILEKSGKLLVCMRILMCACTQAFCQTSVRY